MSFDLNYEISVKKGLPHVGAHLESHRKYETLCLTHINNNTGNPEACKGGLRDLAFTSALMSWFSDDNITSYKQHAYVAGKLDCMIYQKAPLTGIYSPGAPFLSMLMPLLSDHSTLIAWVTAFDGIDLKRAHKGATFEFVTHQAKLALRGEWNALGERSERFLDSPPARMARYAPDNRFHLALARGSIADMESALAEMVTPKEIQWRNEHEGYTGWFIVREAVTYAKIAWRHGYHVHVDTPWIPTEWLPVEPLPEYQEPYPFMQTYDLSTPPPVVTEAI